jgi:heterodisulfide reductase subunit D
MNVVQMKKLSYDEVAKCNKCGFCLPTCPIYLVEKKESASPRGRNAITRAVIEGRLALTTDTQQSIFNCLGCGACNVACLSGVQTQELIFRDRECQVGENIYPQIADRLLQTLQNTHNITDDDNEERGEWQELIRNLPEKAFEKEHAEVIFFVGCVASFFPMVQKIPVNMSRIMEKADVDFTILGGEEWCCGFPLIGAGMPDKMEALMAHNLQKVSDVGAKSIVFTCPSCYHTWKHTYKTDARLYHASQYINDLINDKRIELGMRDTTVTYHDPCDLGRNTGIYEDPRNVLNSIPGLNLVEMPLNRKFSFCCGGGGNLEMTNPELSARVAQMKIAMIEATGAKVVVTSCQQCVRTITGRARKQKNDLMVKDLTEMVVEAME